MVEIKRAFTGETLRVVGGDTLVGAKLQDSNLRGADLSEADLRGADLSQASLRAAEMNDANLEGALLVNANLQLSNLNRAKLRKANLTGANLTNAGLHRADLRGADLSQCLMQGALFTGAMYDFSTVWPPDFDPEKEGAKLSNPSQEEMDADLPHKLPCPECGADVAEDAIKCRHCGAWLGAASRAEEGFIKILGASGETLLKHPCDSLEDAILTGKDLQGANLVNANLRRAKLSRANLTNASLRGAILEGANLSHANMNGANLREAALDGADLSGATLRGAALENASLSGAVLNSANLRQANLSGADLTAADMFGANLFAAILTDVRYDESTQWPAGFNPSNQGAPKHTINGSILADNGAYATPDQLNSRIAAEAMNDMDLGADFAPSTDPGPGPALAGGGPGAGNGSTAGNAALEALINGPAARSSPAAPAPSDCGAGLRPASAPPPEPAIPSATDPAATDGPPWIEKIACPYCAEVIRADAVKCRFCGEWVRSPSHSDMLEAHPEFRRNRTHLFLTASIVVAGLALLLAIGLYLAVGRRTPSATAAIPGAAPKQPQAGRFLNFPDETIGVLSSRPWGSKQDEPWENLGPARGHMPLPPGKELKLIVDSPVRDLSFLKGLGPADLTSLDLIFTELTDEQLESLTGLAGLQELALPATITDAGLPHLLPLVSLTTLNVSISGITLTGLDTLAAMKSLKFLFIPNRISNKAVDTFKRQAPDCAVLKL